MSVRWMTSLSDSFPISNGIQEGGVLSPILFTIYTEDLLSDLHNMGVGCSLASYPGHVEEGTSGLVFTVCACANDSGNLPRMSPIMDKLHVVVMQRITKLDIQLGMWQQCLRGDDFHILSAQGVTSIHVLWSTTHLC